MRKIIYAAFLVVVVGVVSYAYHFWAHFEINGLLLEAVRSGDAAGVRSALARGADPDTARELMSALGWAAHNGRADIIGLLLDHGAHTHNQRACSAVGVAVSRGHYQVLKLLLDRGGSPNDGVPGGPLFFASGAAPAETPSMLRCVNLLVKRGGNVNGTDSAGRTPLSEAVARGNWPLVALLKRLGARMPHHAPAADGSKPTPE